MKNILLVEDDVQISKLLQLHLNGPGYQLFPCLDAEQAISKIEDNNFDLIILDIMLPGMSGLELCRQLRDQHNDIAIMMLTSKSQESDKVLALDLGADDYLTKPFGVLELIARTKALLRRTESKTENDSPVIHFKELQIDKTKRRIALRDNRVTLTPKEFDLLYLMASKPGTTFSRTQLLELVWGQSFKGYEHTVTAHINRLRIKIETNLNQPQYILTSWGTGYRFAE